MFTNYSQTYAANITALAGFLVMIAHNMGYNFAQGDVVFVLGILVNVGGIVWALLHRRSKGDVTNIGTRKRV